MRAQAGRLESIYQQYRDRVDFYIVYIREAHPADEWQAEANVPDGVVFDQPTTAGERETVAEACSLGLPVTIPMLVDTMADDANLAYGAFPERLYLVDGDGRIAYRGGPGPFEFDPDEWEAAIAAHLA